VALTSHAEWDLTWGGATAGGVLYSLDPLLRLPPVRTAWGGVGGFVVGAGPTIAPMPLVDTEPSDWMLPWLEPLCLERGVPPVDVVLTPWPISSRAENSQSMWYEHYTEYFGLTGTTQVCEATRLSDRWQHADILTQGHHNDTTI
jgi:hypothetical protein